MQSFTKVPDQVGYLLLHETGATISILFLHKVILCLSRSKASLEEKVYFNYQYYNSSGELENDEKTAETIFNIITLTDKLDPAAFPNEAFNKISICYNDFCYVICMSNKKIHIVKRRIPAGINTSTMTSAEPHLIDLQVPVNNSINA